MKKCLVALFFLSTILSANAEDNTWVNFGGLSYHIPAKNYNDTNIGFGVENNFGNRFGILGGTYYNSLHTQAYYLGATYQIKKNVFLGANFDAMVYASTGYQNNGVPAIIPFGRLCWKYGCVMSNGVVSTALLRIPVNTF